MSLPFLIFAYFAIQTVFTVLDLRALWVDARTPAVPFRSFCREHGLTLSFLGATWLAYLMIQFGGTLVFPSLGGTLSRVAQALHLGSLETAHLPSRPLQLLAVALALGASYLIAGFWDYLFHRFLLHGRVFWFLHESHHLPRRIFNGMPGISVRPYVGPVTFLTHAATGICMLAGIHAARLDWLLPRLLTVLPAIILWISALGCVSHSLFLKRFPWTLKWTRFALANSPHEHFLHHAIGVEGNYGNFTLIWDRVFGTYLDPRDFAGEPLRYGLTYEQDFLGTLTFSKLRIPRATAQALGLHEFYNVGGPEPSA